jgi:hypothetical protein
VWAVYPTRLKDAGFKIADAFQRHELDGSPFLLSVYASASSSDDPGIRQLVPHATAALKAVP